MKVVVAGYIVPFPVPAHFWHTASFALGFRDLGHEVVIIDDNATGWGWDPVKEIWDEDFRPGRTFLGREANVVGLDRNWAFRHAARGWTDGPAAAEIHDRLAEADLFVNVSCTTQMRPEYLAIPHRAAVDTDPVFLQVCIARGDRHAVAIPEQHTRLFTFGRPPLPGQQHEWVSTRQPVATALWGVATPPAPGAAFTTVATWRAYEPVTWDGQTFGAKDDSFRTFADLPAAAPAPLAVALGGSGRWEGHELLASHGWRLDDPAAIAASTDTYRGYIAASAGELGLAKHGYVASRSGWFSERSCCYLAMGRPVVAQDTGFSDWLPVGKGLLAFDDARGAVRALEDVLADPAGHADSARRLVEEHFEAADVCRALLDAL